MRKRILVGVLLLGLSLPAVAHGRFSTREPGRWLGELKRFAVTMYSRLGLPPG